MENQLLRFKSRQKRALEEELFTMARDAEAVQQTLECEARQQKPELGLSAFARFSRRARTEALRLAFLVTRCFPCTGA
jgi:hypothetical protein